jgi:hypothetical protein
MSWGKDLARIWLQYVPPARPSASELRIYTSYLRQVQSTLHRKVNLLILGSTTEFRDWGYEHDLNVTVIDANIDYYRENSLSTRYQNSSEKLVNKRWQDMDFQSEFDIIVGDMVIGNLLPGEVPDFLERVSQALTSNGIFMTKSVFKNRKRIKNLEETVRKYYITQRQLHPLSALSYDLLMHTMDGQQEMLSFHHMWRTVNEANKSGFLKRETLESFSKLGWSDHMNIQFYMPEGENWEAMINKSFHGFRKEYSDDIYTKDIPLYIIQNRYQPVFISV